MKNEIKELITRSQEEIEASQLLLENRHYSPTISRSYYAMFYAAEAILLTKEAKFSSHKGVITNFSQFFVKAGIFSKEMSENLVKVFELRLDADYEFAQIATKKEAKDALIAAREFVEKIVKYLKEEGYA